MVIQLGISFGLVLNIIYISMEIRHDFVFVR